MLLKTIFYVLTAMVLFICFAAVILSISRSRLKHKLKISTPNGIQISEKIVIGGIPQWIQIRGEDRKNPILFFIHGGPGGALINLAHIYQREWEKYFTVVNWDQRASGKTRLESDTEEVKRTITMERMIEDAREVAEYVRKRIGQEHIFVLGQSWGSALGTQVVLKYPEIFTAYIGTGQAVDAVRNFRISCEHMLEVTEAAGDMKMHDRLAKVMRSAYEGENSVQDIEFQKAYIPAISKYGVASAKYRSFFRIALLYLWSKLTSPESTVCEILQRTFSKKHTSDVFLDFRKSPSFSEWRLEALGTVFAVPYYQINGDNDWQTPYTLAREYYDRVSAPIKRWYTLKNAAHMVQFDNLPDFTKYLLEIRDEVSVKG